MRRESHELARTVENKSKLNTAIAVVLAILAFVAIEIAVHSIFIRSHDTLPPFARYLFILAVGLYISSYVLFGGYVYRDSSRRGMPKAPWMIIVLVIHYGVGFLLFFWLRKPPLQSCIHCGRAIGMEQAFCSFCGGAQENAGKQAGMRIS
jgi:hypothetical protein